MSATIACQVYAAAIVESQNGIQQHVVEVIRGTFHVNGTTIAHDPFGSLSCTKVVQCADTTISNYRSKLCPTTQMRDHSYLEGLAHRAFGW